MSPKTLTFIVGLLLGAAVTLVVAKVRIGDDEDVLSPEVARLTAENSDLLQRIQALADTFEEERTALREELLAASKALEEHHPDEIEQHPPTIEDEPAPTDLPAAGAPPTEEEVGAAIKKFRMQLGSIIQGQEQGQEAAAELQELFARVDAETMQKILDRYGEEDDLNAKLILAHALAQSRRPEATEMLEGIVLDRNNGFMERRLASHGLAFVDDPELTPFLLDIARNDPERGIRANASFGLARAGSEEGIAIYAAATDEAFKEKDPAAIGYLGGFSLLGKKGLPVVRERLVTYEDPQIRIMLIQVVREQKDRGSISILRGLENDPKAGQAVQEEARKAIEAIEAPEDPEED